ncbi:hypothetical protein KGQ64_08025 [bacterium]|nr:hypothetical protein [bacterium]
MAQRLGRFGLAVAFVAVGLLAAREAQALKISDTINLTARAYGNVRIGTMDKQSTRPANQPPECFANPGAANCVFGGTFPYSHAGDVIQNRYFLEMKWQHDLVPWTEQYLKYAPWTMLGNALGAKMPEVTSFRYYLTYRGEADSIYNWGADPYSHQGQSLKEIETQLFVASSGALPWGSEALRKVAQYRVDRVRNRLRAVGDYRNRLFQAFVDWEQGPFFMRFGRQSLVWGETDVFRLLDNINPVDNSFGGFFLDLDERRVPLDMLRVSYNLGSIGPVDQAFFEGYWAFDRTVAFVPGAPAGSPWSNPLGPPTGQTLALLDAPDLSAHNFRGGGRFVFNVADTTFTLASYQTMFDIPAVRFRAAVPTDPGYTSSLDIAGVPGFQSVIAAEQTAPLVWVNGASMTTALPKLFSVLRAEAAVFNNEALFRGPTETGFAGKGLTGQYVSEFLSPVLNGTYDTVVRRNTFNMAVGWDTNQFIRFLNPNQTFFISTQFFYRHIFGMDRNGSVCQSCRIGLPIPEQNNSTRIVPLVENSYLQTLAINTTYNTKVPWTEVNMQVTPGFNMFYDWQGMFVFQPNIRFIRDPFRFIVDYSAINSGVYRYQLGLVRDRSNVRMQFEYVL